MKKIRYTITLAICFLLLFTCWPTMAFAGESTEELNGNNNATTAPIANNTEDLSKSSEFETPERDNSESNTTFSPFSNSDISNNSDLAYTITVSYGSAQTLLYQINKPKDGPAVLSTSGTITIPPHEKVFIEITFNKGFDASGMGVGDYFSLELPREVFSFTNVSHAELKANNVILGHWTLINNVVTITFNEIAASSQGVSGGLSLQGRINGHGNSTTVTPQDGQSITITIEDQTIHPNPEPPEDGIDAPWSEGSLFYKAGRQIAFGGKTIGWLLNANEDMMSSIISGETPENRHDIWIEDSLSPDLYDITAEDTNSGGVYDYYIEAPFNRLNISGEWTNSWGTSIGTTDQFVHIIQTGTETEYTDFKTAIQATKRATFFIFNITSDGTPTGAFEKKVVGMYLGDICSITPNENGLRVATDEIDFKNKLRRYMKLSEEEIQRYYDVCNTLDFSPIYLRLHFKADLKEIDSIENVENIATLTYNSFEQVEHGATVTIETYDSHITALPAGSVQLIKTDEDGNVIQGAIFHLELQNAQRGWEVVPNSERVTDMTGVILIENLLDGTYRFVEKQAAPGYEEGSGSVTPQEFTIDMTTDTQGVTVRAVNKRIKGDIEIRKTNPQGFGLGGAHFILSRILDGETVYYGKDSNSSEVWIPERENAHHFVTDAQGNIIISNLDWGTYALEEVLAPEGYLLDTAPKSVVINAQYVMDTQSIVQFINNPKQPRDFDSDGDSVSENFFYPRDSFDPGISSKSSLPQTGDDRFITLLCIVITSFLVIMLGLLLRRHKE